MATAIVIKAMMSCSAALRPLRSAYKPINTPPTGRMKNPTPKVAIANNREAYSLSAGKNKREMMTVINPYTTKSYHSKALPITAATIWRVRGVLCCILFPLKSCSSHDIRHDIASCNRHRPDLLSFEIYPVNSGAVRHF